MALVESCVGRADKLQKDLVEIQRQISEHAERAGVAKAELAEAELKRDELYKSLQSAPVAGGARPSLPGPGALDGALAASALLPDEWFAQLGRSRSETGDFLQSLSEAFVAW